MSDKRYEIGLPWDPRDAGQAFAAEMESQEKGPPDLRIGITEEGFIVLFLLGLSPIGMQEAVANALMEGLERVLAERKRLFPE